MSKYAFFRSNVSLVIVGLVLGLSLGFKLANTQYRNQQGAALNRDIAKAASGISNSRDDLKAGIEKAKANPNDVGAQIEAAIQLIQLERPQESLPFLEQARTISPNERRVSASFGIAYFMMGQYDQSTDWLKRSREQGEDDPIVTSFLIGSYIQTRKNLDEAGRLLKELETKDVDPGKLARIREDLNTARAGGTEKTAVAPSEKSGPAPTPNTVLSHGPEEPKPKASQPGGKN